MRRCQFCGKNLHDYDSNHERACGQTNYCYCEGPVLPVLTVNGMCTSCYRPRRPSRSDLIAMIGRAANERYAAALDKLAEL